jgi:chromosome segregation ATPase
MTHPTFLRRALVVLGVVASITVGVATVEAAATWTAQAAPLQVAPESVDSLKARLAAEEARSTELAAQIDALRGHAGELGTALNVATDRIAADAETAQALRDRLGAAKERLAALERLIAKTRAAARTAAAAPRATAAAAGGEHEHEHEGVDDD